MNKKFSIELCSDLSFEGMVVDISYETKSIASINYDKGIDRIEIEIFPTQKSFFYLDDFFSVLEEAKQLAIKCAKEDGLN